MIYLNYFDLHFAGLEFYCLYIVFSQKSENKMEDIDFKILTNAYKLSTF